MLYTLEDIEEGLEENADFEEVGSVSKAKAFITWMNRWLIRRPDSASNGASSLSINKGAMLDLLKRAQAFVSATPTDSASGANVKFLSFRDDFR
jgi:hypothetical protein